MHHRTCRCFGASSYSPDLFVAVSQVQVPGRVCDEKHMHALHRALDKYYHITAGQKVADFFEGVGRSVQVGGDSSVAVARLHLTVVHLKTATRVAGALLHA